MITLLDEREWFCAQVKENKVSLYRLAKSILKSEEDTRDAVQESVLTAYEKFETLRDRNKFRPWLMRILANTAYEMLRKRKCEVDIDSMDLIAPETGNSDDSVSLRAALDTLSNDLRDVTVLFYYEEMSVKEISHILGITQSAVKTRLSRARQKLKMILSVEGALA